MAEEKTNDELKSEMKVLTGEALEEMQLFATFADELEFKFLRDESAESAAYQVEIEGDQFRCLLAMLQKAKDWRERMVTCAKAAGVKGVTLDDFLERGQQSK